MDSQYLLHDPSQVHSPALLFYRDVIRQNIDGLIARVGGDPKRLRPHVKTHKTREIAQMQLRAGITNHKCATIAEAEMLAGVGAADVLLAYNLVGPNCGRLAKLIEKHRGCRFSTLVDHPIAAQGLSDVMSRAGQTVDVLLDVDVGQHRTGIAPGGEAVRLYETLTRRDAWTPEAECSPGTCVLNDANYAAWFADLGEFKHAALLLTRVISRPTSTRLTLDLGYKAVASDPPAGQRCVLLNVPDAKAVIHNEEHFVVETPAADRFQPGDEVYAMPTHICPTCALHREAYIVEAGAVTDKWAIAARDRVLHV